MPIVAAHGRDAVLAPFTFVNYPGTVVTCTQVGDLSAGDFKWIFLGLRTLQGNAAAQLLSAPAIFLSVATP